MGITRSICSLPPHPISMSGGGYRSVEADEITFNSIPSFPLSLFPSCPLSLFPSFPLPYSFDPSILLALFPSFPLSFLSSFLLSFILSPLPSFFGPSFPRSLFPLSSCPSFPTLCPHDLFDRSLHHSLILPPILPFPSHILPRTQLSFTSSSKQFQVKKG